MIRNIMNKRRMRMHDQYVHSVAEIPADTYIDPSLNIDIRKSNGNKRLTVGNNCMLAGNYIFETESGYVTIGNRCHIGGSTFISRSGIDIEDDVTIAWGVTCYDHDSHSVRWSGMREYDTIQEYKDMIQYGDPIKNKNWDIVNTAPIRICSKAWIGMNALILKGVTIGEGAVVAAGSVVTKDVEPWTVVAGNPAKVVKMIKE